MAPLGVSCGYNRVQVFIFRSFVLNALTCKVCHIEKTGDLGDQLKGWESPSKCQRDGWCGYRLVLLNVILLLLTCVTMYLAVTIVVSEGSL